jgi:membrane protease YdiL (CAAX protease family)
MWTLMMMFILATVWAPVVEETMFRGAFYSHLRRVTNPIVAALVVGFVFAIIHPQGIGLVPPLMTLGAVFALIREWRGSLIGSMTAHALHNGFLVTMMAVLFS